MLSGGLAGFTSSFNRQGSPRSFELRNRVISDCVWPLLREPFLPAAHDFARAHEGESNRVFKSFSLPLPHENI